MMLLKKEMKKKKVEKKEEEVAESEPVEGEVGKDEEADKVAEPNAQADNKEAGGEASHRMAAEALAQFRGGDSPCKNNFFMAHPAAIGLDWLLTISTGISAGCRRSASWWGMWRSGARYGASKS